MTTETALARYQAGGPSSALTPAAAMEVGAILAKSGFFPEAKEAAKAAAKILLGQELGLPPMASMKNIYILDNKGKATFQIAAATQLALVRQSGRYDYKIVERSEKRAAILFERFNLMDDGRREKLDDYLAEFTAEDAKRAGSDDKSTYKAHPKNMLYWRCVSLGVNAFCPDVLCGPFYSEGEIPGGLTPEDEPEAVANPEDAIPAAWRVVDAPRTEAVVQAPRPVCETGPALVRALEAQTAAAAPVESAQAQPSAATPDLTPEESLDRTAAAVGIKAGEGPLAPDGPATTDEESLGNLIPITHARGLIRRIAALGAEDVLPANDAKDVNSYLKEILPGAGAKAAWAAAGVEVKAGVKITRAQVMKLCGYLAKS